MRKTKSHLWYSAKQIQTFYKMQICSTQPGTQKNETQQQQPLVDSNRHILKAGIEAICVLTVM